MELEITTTKGKTAIRVGLATALAALGIIAGCTSTDAKGES
jgi:hypothetical protein